MIQKFIENGYAIVEFHEKADIYVINTCTVTNISDRKSRQMLRRAKEMNPNSVIVAVRMLCAGCQRRSRENGRNRFVFGNE